MQALESLEALFYEDLGLLEARIQELASRLHFPSYMLYMTRGGKRLRPLIALAVCKSLGGSAMGAVDYAAAIELVHSAVLVHDDILDRHNMRRGKKPLYRLLDPRRSLLLSDMLLSSALKLTSSADGSKDTLSDTVYTLCRGVAMEPLNPLRFLRRSLNLGILPTFYELIARLKTGELFGAAAKMGAIAAGAPAKTIAAAYQYGVEVGTAYQLADDLVDFISWSKYGSIPDLGSLLTVTLFIPYASTSYEMSRYLLSRVLHSYVLFRLLTPIRLGKALVALTPPRGIVQSLVRSALNKIRSYCSSAKRALASFPDNKYSWLLLQLPNYVVNRQLAEVGLSLEETT
ncbi:MAG: hypothetical protein C4339_00945 [Nitrososphaerota archaeon]